MLRYVMMRILAPTVIRSARSPGVIAPPLGGWEGLNLQESVTVDASGGNWHSLLTASPFCPACPGICELAGRRSGTDGRRGQANFA